MGEETDHFAGLYDPWAGEYDRHVERVLGPLLQSLTRRTLAVLREATLDGKSAFDMGAGTGRVAIPLAREGWDVVAIDPSSAMLGRLGEKAAVAGARVGCERSTVGEFDPGEGRDAVLCLFGVLNHLTRDAQLERAATNLARCARRRGFVLIDLAQRSLLEGAGCERVADDGEMYTWLGGRGGRVPLRYWERGIVEEEFRRAGLHLSNDLTPRFCEARADVLLFRRNVCVGD